jgi:hypothetical protein
VGQLSQIDKLSKILQRKPNQVAEDLKVCKRIVEDPIWAINTFFQKGKGWMFDPLVPYQEEGVKRLERADIDRQCEIWPRGHCKTTLLTRAYTALKAATGQYKYIVIFGAVKENAQGNKEAFRTIFEMPLFRDLQWYLSYWNGAEIAEFSGGECKLGNGTLIEFRSFGGEARGLNRAGRPDLIVLDDILPTEAATSEAIREDVTNRYFSMIRPMGEAGSKINVIGTVMHRDDLLWKLGSGKIKGYTSTILKAYDEHNVPLWPERWSYEDLMRVREDEYVNAGRIHLFRREYLSDPAEDESHPLSKFDWPVHNNKTLTSGAMYRVIAIDHAHGTGRDNFVIGEGWWNNEGHCYLADFALSNEWDLNRRLHEVLKFLERRRPHKLVCQRTVESLSFIEQLTGFLKERKAYMPIEQPTANKAGDKNERIYAYMQPRLENENISIPEHDPKWARQIVSEAHNFDMTTKNNMDDCLDVASMILKYGRPALTVEPPKTTGDPLKDRILRDMMRPARAPRVGINRARPKWQVL